MRPYLQIAALAVSLTTDGCVMPTPEQQASALTVQAGAFNNRQAQARRYDTRDERGLMAATLGVLQDLGYTINETSAGAGLINATKDRQGTRIRVSVVVQPTADRIGMIARVSIQSASAGVLGPQPRIETITDNAIYQQFFERLSQSLFLEAHQI